MVSELVPNILQPGLHALLALLAAPLRHQPRPAAPARRGHHVAHTAGTRETRQHCGIELQKEVREDLGLLLVESAY